MTLAHSADLRVGDWMLGWRPYRRDHAVEQNRREAD